VKGRIKGPYENEEVQPSVGVLGVLEALKDRVVLVELTLLDRDVDPDDVLPHDTPRADVQMSVRIQGQRDLWATDMTVKWQTQLPSYP
jgi:hypothetical protein